jgi:hypothetical protein
MAEGIVPVKLLVENDASSTKVQFAIDDGIVPVNRLFRTLTCARKISRIIKWVVRCELCLDQEFLKQR